MKMKFLVSLFFFTNCFRELHSNTENRNHLGQWRLDVIKLLFHSNFQKIYLKKIKNNTSKLQLFVTLLTDLEMLSLLSPCMYGKFCFV